MHTLDDAQALLATSLRPLPPVVATIEEAIGLRLAEAAVARMDMPPADASSVDGYALRASDVGRGVSLRVAFALRAGERGAPLPRGAAAIVATGAVLPAGADAVVADKDAVAVGGAVRTGPVEEGANVRRRSESFAAGATVAGAGAPLTPAAVGLLVSAGVTAVSVVPRPRVAVISTGSELVGAGEAPGEGMIHDSNGPLLAALARQALAPVTRRLRVGDGLAETVAALELAAAEADVVVSAGGTGAGKCDRLAQALAVCGGEKVLRGVRMRPGGSLIVARFGRRWYVGLPGRPGAVLVGWRLFVRPLLEALAGDGGAFDEECLRARVDRALAGAAGSIALRSATVTVANGALAAVLPAPRGSECAVGRSQANALLRLEAGAAVRAGEAVTFYPLPWKWTA